VYWAPEPSPIVTDRPCQLFLRDRYSPQGRSVPLHGLGTSAFEQSFQTRYRFLPTEDKAMATSPEAFEQVKNILKKLDQSIDAARDRRLASQPGATRTVSRDPAAHTIGGTDPIRPIGQPRPTNRARPMLRRSDSM